MPHFRERLLGVELGRAADPGGRVDGHGLVRHPPVSECTNDSIRHCAAENHS